MQRGMLQDLQERLVPVESWWMSKSIVREAFVQSVA